MADQSAPMVLVTRPQPGADVTAKDLRELGYRTTVLPFTETVSIQITAEQIAPDKTDAIAVTSAAALRHLDQVHRNALSAIPIFAVGDATAKAAQDLGFKNVRSADGSGTELVALLQNEMPKASSIVYFCGRTRLSAFENEISNAGFRVELCETYETNKVSQLTYKIDELFDAVNIDAIALYSGISAEIYASWWCASKRNTNARNPQIYCISERAKAQLPEELRPHAIICEAPNHNAMIAAIRQHL